jgi:hypothetical protein
MAKVADLGGKVFILLNKSNAQAILLYWHITTASGIKSIK